MRELRFALAAPIVVALVATAARADDLVGEWAGENNGVPMGIVFEANGSFRLSDELKGRWKRSGSTLELEDQEGSTATCDVKIQGDTLVLSGGTLGQTLTFKRKGAKPAPAPKKAGFREALERALKGAEPKGELSRPPQESLKDVKKLAPKFKSATREWKDPEGKYTFKIPEKWTFTGGQDASCRYAVVNYGVSPGEPVKHQLVFWQVPVLPSDAQKGFKARLEEGAAKLAALYPGVTRGETKVYEAPSGLIGRVDFSGTLTNELVQNAPVVATIAVRQVKHCYLAFSVLSLKEAAGELDDDALAVLDAAVIVLKDRDPEAERKLVGEWVVPTKGGLSLETYKFNADGTYAWHFESSFVVNVKDPSDSSRITASAGGAAVDDERGRYEVRGDTIYFVSNKGEQGSFFQIWSEGGKTYLKVGKATFVR